MRPNLQASLPSGQTGRAQLAIGFGEAEAALALEHQGKQLDTQLAGHERGSPAIRRTAELAFGQIITLALQIGVEFVDNRLPSWNFEARDVGVGNPRQMLDQRT